ncbi:MAG: hypothetical protein AB8F65_13320 [Woeseiaceae bacterium]
MAKMSHLINVARQGYADMYPALQRAFNDSPADDQLRRVFGIKPRSTVLLLSLVCIVIGFIVERQVPEFTGEEYINWPAAAVALVFALLFRRYLFSTQHAKPDDFPWLAATLIPATATLVLISIGLNYRRGVVDVIDDGPFFMGIGYVAELLARSCSVAAAITIAVAALSYSRNWVSALIDLAVHLFLFLLALQITAFIMLDVGIMDRILSAIIEGIFNYRFPEWVGDFADQVTYAGLLLVFYFSVIGATWTVCRQQFSTLLETGEISIIKSIKEVIDPPSEKSLRKREQKAESKQRKAEQKAAKKAAKNSKTP